MSKLTIQGSLRETLADLSDVTELYSEDGRFLGYFKPPQYRHQEFENDVSDEELLRRAKEDPDGRSWSEIRRELEARQA